MNDKLLGEFLSEDGDMHARQKLLDAIGGSTALDAPVCSKYIFNRFNISIDLGERQVIIEDDLMVGKVGEQRLCLEEFLKALRKNEEKDKSDGHN